MITDFLLYTYLRLNSPDGLISISYFNEMENGVMFETAASNAIRLDTGISSLKPVVSLLGCHLNSCVICSAPVSTGHLCRAPPVPFNDRDLC